MSIKVCWAPCPLCSKRHSHHAFIVWNERRALVGADRPFQAVFILLRHLIGWLLARLAVVSLAGIGWFAGAPGGFGCLGHGHISLGKPIMQACAAGALRPNGWFF